MLNTLSTELAAASPERAISAPGLLIIDAFSAVMAPTLGRAQQTQGTSHSGLNIEAAAVG